MRLDVLSLPRLIVIHLSVIDFEFTAYVNFVFLLRGN